MRQWVENLAEKIKTLNRSDKHPGQLVMNHAIFNVNMVHNYSEIWTSIPAISFMVNNIEYVNCIKLYEDEYDLLKEAFDNRINELDQQEINKFIDLCK